ncbi:hypothetical protein SETIT_4G175700v2 [Setaria italica]|uniref:Uncharacterized protein n=2 Tax=Setaria TaxID=4554 RepID=A0A368QX75_SETIT|nr:hypothetical protein SETIT_4G175700v2 [Setaria italica]
MVMPSFSSIRVEGLKLDDCKRSRSVRKAWTTKIFRESFMSICW